MNDDGDLLTVNPANNPGGATSGLHRATDERQHQGKRHRQFRRSGEFFRPLAKAAEEANERLKANNVPFRFCVYRKDGRVMLDLVELDRKGKVSRTVTRDITDEDFGRWIEDIAKGEGLVLDWSA